MVPVANMDDIEPSDEEEDRQALIHQNETTAKSLNPGAAAVFDIGDLGTRLGPPRFGLCKRFVSNNKRYLLAIGLPVFILIVYFSTDVRNLFPASGVWSLKIDSLSDRMRESELQALYLLKQQKLGLLSLWNHTFTNYSSFASNSTSSSREDLLVGGLKSAVLKQISLNKEIQQVLLSSHSDNFSESAGEYGILGFSGLDGCQKVDPKFSERRTIAWKPDSNRFLFAICLSGQMSNHLICLEKHMFFAAILNRILVIPSSKVDYQYNRVLDIDHINKCMGRKVVITFEEFSEANKHHMHIDRFICYFSLPVPCYLDEEHAKKLKSLGISMGKLEPAWKEDTKKPNERTVEDVKSKFSFSDDVIAIGDVFYADVERQWVMQPGGPLAHKCRTLIEPSRLIMLTAQRFVQTFLGKNFIALHFRRHGFLKFCNAKKPSCFFPIPQAADCISRVVARANTPVIYLSTDAAESETSLLQSLIVMNGKVVPLVKRPGRNSAEKWDALLYRHGLEQDNQVEAMLDKTICAMSDVFIGASGSTFTEDILRLRKDWGSASLCDEYLCQGEEPNVIAEDE